MSTTHHTLHRRHPVSSVVSAIAIWNYVLQLQNCMHVRRPDFVQQTTMKANLRQLFKHSLKRRRRRSVLVSLCYGDTSYQPSRTENSFSRLFMVAHTSCANEQTMQRQ